MKQRVLVALLTTFGIAAVGCGDDDEETVPTTGAIEVVTVTTGDGIDADGYTVTLDGVDGPSVGANSSVTLSNLTAGTYSVGLTGISSNCQTTDNPRDVNVVAGQTATAPFDVTCEAVDQPPVADAGQDQTIVDADHSGSETVTLDGSGSADDGGIVNWSWSVFGAETGTGETLTLDARVGEYTVTLTVSDEAGNTDTDEVLITVVASTENQAPVADAGPNQPVEDADDSGDEAVTLDGSGSTDADGTIVSWSWSEDGVELGTGETLNSVFDAGVHTVTLTVTDDDGDTGTDDMVVTVVPAGENLPPVADAGPDQRLADNDGDLFAAVTLDGSGSTDADGTIVSWEWQEGGTIYGSAEVLDVELPIELHRIVLTVTDDLGATDSDSVLVLVTQPSLGGVVGYERDGYDGDAILLRQSVTDFDLLPGGACELGSTWDDCFSSIRVPEGWTAILFELSDFRGDSLVVTESIENLDSAGGTDWDNRTSSVRVLAPE